MEELEIAWLVEYERSLSAYNPVISINGGGEIQLHSNHRTIMAYNRNSISIATYSSFFTFLEYFYIVLRKFNIIDDSMVIIPDESTIRSNCSLNKFIYERNKQLSLRRDEFFKAQQIPS